MPTFFGKDLLLLLICLHKLHFVVSFPTNTCNQSRRSFRAIFEGKNEVDLKNKGTP